MKLRWRVWQFIEWMFDLNGLRKYEASRAPSFTFIVPEGAKFMRSVQEAFEQDLAIPPSGIDDP